MIRIDAERIIKNYIETSMSNIELAIEGLNNRGDSEFLNIANREMTALSHYFNIYQSTVTAETFDDVLYLKMCDLRTLVNSHTPHGW
jgi:hypothetical protein